MPCLLLKWLDMAWRGDLWDMVAFWRAQRHHVDDLAAATQDAAAPMENEVRPRQYHIATRHEISTDTNDN